MMKKIAFIVPYYGKLPSYFKVWVHTAGQLCDQMVDFFIITDLQIDFNLAQNIKLVNLSFEKLKEKFQEYFDFAISLETPYKLCDFRPSYGLVFGDLLKEYDFWGHCDIDMMWGDFRKFISDDVLASFDKVLYLGHCVLYRNCFDMNNLFKKKAGLFNYKRVFSAPEYYSFDEHPGMMQIVKKYGIKNYIVTNQADISPKYSSLYISRMKNYPIQMLFWKNGKVLRYFTNENGVVSSDEFFYMHFQKKAPVDNIDWNSMDSNKAIMFTTNELKSINIDSLSNYSIRDFLFKCCSEIGETDYKNKYHKDRVRKFLKMGFKQKKVSILIALMTKKTNNYIKKYSGIINE